MNFAVDGSHRDFYRKHQWIEFEGLLSPARLLAIEKEIHEVLCKRIGIPDKEKPSAEEPLFSEDAEFRAGRDLWRGRQSLKKIALSKNLAQVASEIIEQKPLRIGYDQFLPSPLLGLEENNFYTDLLKTTPTLQEMSPLQGVLCGLLICLKSTPNEEKPSTLFSPVAGNGVLFAPDHPIAFDELVSRQGSKYLLIAYAGSKSVFIHQSGDTHPSHFKKLGLNFGDRLNDLLNPIVYG